MKLFFVLVSLFLFTELLYANKILHQEAYQGSPFGVGKIQIEFDSYYYQMPGTTFFLAEKSQRTFYPAFEVIEAKPAWQENYKKHRVTFYFLFQGDAPLELDCIYKGHEYKPLMASLSLAPAKSKDKHQKLLESWWDLYHSSAQAVLQGDNYNPKVEHYLMRTLAKRLNLPAKPLYPPTWAPLKAVNDALGLFTGAESVKIAMQEHTLLAQTHAEEMSVPFPAGINIPSVPVPEFTEAPIESIANYVPKNCFYLRFGNFGNFQWFRKIIDEWGSKSRDIIASRGLDYKVNQRIKRQLALKDTFLSKILGGTLISDVALIGTDFFFNEGATIGIIYEARNGKMLQEQLQKIRREVMSENPGATEETVTIKGHSVSFISMPENQVRSFYAIYGSYHLISTSKTLVERFYETGPGKESLASLKEFKYARSLRPLTEEDKVFVYLSDPFFQTLLSPQYRVEMTRRIQATTEIDLLQLAQLTAQAEKRPADSLARLVENDFLPNNFGERPDGSQPITTEDGRVIDSMRGEPGSFLPIIDVALTGMTPGEEQSYQEFVRNYRVEYGNLDPVIVGIKSHATDKGEKIVLDVHITPYAQSRYGFLYEYLKPRDQLAISNPPHNIFSLQLNALKEYLFVGMKDYDPSFVIREGKILSNGRGMLAQKEIPYYLGVYKAQGQHGLSTWFLGSFEAKKDEFIKRGADWIYCFDDFIVLSREQKTINATVPFIKANQEERTSQVRLQISDLSQTKLFKILNAAGYLHLRNLSTNNLAFMYHLNQQLHIPLEKCLPVAESLLHANLSCPLGGEYKTMKKAGQTCLQSTALQKLVFYTMDYIPTRYRLPLLEWFAGFKLEFNIDANTIWTHIELEVHALKTND